MTGTAASSSSRATEQPLAVAPDRIADVARMITKAQVAGLTVQYTTAHATADDACVDPDTLDQLDDVLQQVEAPTQWDDIARVDASLAEATGWQAVICIPIRDARRERIGHVWAASPQRDHFGPDSLDHLQAVAHLVGSPGAKQTGGEQRPAERRALLREHGLVVTNPKGKILWANRGFVDMCGYPLDELVGQTPQALLHGPETDKATARQMGAYMRAGQGFEAEIVNYRKSGEPYVVRIQSEPIPDKQGNVAGFMALETDVSARQQVAGTKSLECNLLTAAMDTVPAVVVILETDGRIVRLNQTGTDLTGYAPDELIGARMTDRLVPDEEADRVRAHLDALRTGQSRSAFTCHWMLRDGSRRLIDWSNTVVSDASGAVTYIVGTGIDITEQRKLEHELMQVSNAERRRIGQDLHDILASHLAGTAMVAKSLSQKRARNEPISTEDLDLIVDHIHEAAQQARALSHSLLPTRIEGGRLVEALRTLAQNKEELTGVQHNVDANIDGACIDDRVARHLYRIAYEGINNAIKHGKPTRVAITLRQADDRLLLTVEDNGVGIGPDDAEDDGMGLRMMQHRANLIGATLEMQPVEPGGTRVQCSVPTNRVGVPAGADAAR